MSRWLRRGRAKSSVPPLAEYRRKRDPKQTPEPFGGEAQGQASRSSSSSATMRARLHYDFRLELDGALASWAVPKGVPIEPGEQHLAVHVEDHPLDYATFEGEIPKGKYGAGHGRDLGQRHVRARRGARRTAA